MFGYMVAQDRLWQLELYKRSSRGCLAEIFGPDLLNQDTLVRSTGPDASEAWLLLAKWSKRVLELTFDDDLGPSGNILTRFNTLVRELNPPAGYRNAHLKWFANKQDSTAPQTR